MTKDEAAKLLGVSTRAIERYAKAGKLVVHYEDKPSGGQISLYNDSEVLALKEEQKKKELAKANQAVNQTTNTAPSSVEMSDSSLVVKQSDTLTEPLDKVSHRSLEPIFLELLERLTKAMEQGKVASQQPSTQLQSQVNLTDKLTLSLDEAAALSGLSKYWLTKAIKNSELKAAKRGHGWNIKQTDLVKYIDLLK